MPLNRNDKLLIEAIGNMLDQTDRLGLPDDLDDFKEERGYEYLHNQVDDMFRLKAADLVHCESACAAFSKIHSYRYIDDANFVPAVESELRSMAMPKKEQEDVVKFIETIREELKKESGVWAERDAGFNPNLDEIIEVSKPTE